jgi:hypothetical protein
MKETVLSFNVPNLITVGIMVFVFSALVGFGIRIYKGATSD